MIIHIGTQIQVILGQVSEDGTSTKSLTINGNIEDLTEQSWVKAFKEVKAKFDEIKIDPTKFIVE